MEAFKYGQALVRTMFSKKEGTFDIQITEQVYDKSFSDDNQLEISLDECTENQNQSMNKRVKKIIRNLYNRQESLEAFADSESSISSYCFSNTEFDH